MFIQLPEEKKSLIFPLFKNRQPNTSALWCYFDGILPGKTFVDDIKVPTKAICKLDMSWVYISDNADFEWIEETLREIIKHAWIQVVWVLERGSKFRWQNWELLFRGTNILKENLLNKSQEKLN